MAFLHSNTGPDGGDWYDLDRPKTVLGRHPGCNVIVEEPSVSRYHAHILNENGHYYVEDLGSRNGTFVNEEQVHGRGLLHEGDVVRICDSTFTFRLMRPAAPSPPTTGSLSGELEAFDQSGFAAVLVDDDQKQVMSTIMSKLDVSSSRGRVMMSASPEVKLGALLEINQSLGRALSLDAVLPQVLKSLFKIFLQADRGFIVLQEGEILIPRWTQQRREGSDETIRLSRTICRQVMETKEAILSADAATDSRFEMSQSIADFRIRSMMCAPLVNSEGKAFGVLQIDTLDQRNRFRPDDLEVLVAVASQAGIAIDNAQLYERSLRQREIERDLELAHQVQKGFLPQTRPLTPGYEFFDYYQAANHVGGDYFDYIPLPDGRLAIALADVVGHGIAAALLMAKLSAEARFSLASTGSLKEAMLRLNDSICRMGVDDRFVTCVIAMLHPDNHEVTIVNAGHMAPLLRRTNGNVEEAGEEITGLPLGILEGYDYDESCVQLHPGEWMALYTDGINECTNRANEAYGIDRLRRKVGDASDGPLALGQRVVADVRGFIGPGPQEDDMCLVCFGRESTWGHDSALADDAHADDAAHPAGATAIQRG